MTIASEITRLQWAKADIKTAIQGKWVTVPASAKLDTYASYVNQIVQWWWVAWIIGTAPVRTSVQAVGNNQERSDMLWNALSYSIWDFVFIVAYYSWYNSNNYNQAKISVYRWKKWDSDYSSTSTTISNTTSNDFRWQWIKLTVSWSTVTFETCILRWTDWWVNANYRHHTQTYNMSNDTRGTRSVETYTWTDNPYFSWYVNNQELYTASLEPTRLSYTVLKFAPTFN